MQAREKEKIATEVHSRLPDLTVPSSWCTVQILVLVKGQNNSILTMPNDLDSGGFTKAGSLAQGIA